MLLIAGCVAAPSPGVGTVSPEPGPTGTAAAIASAPPASVGGLAACTGAAPGIGPGATPAQPSQPTPAATVAPVFMATATPNPGEPVVVPGSLRALGGAAGTHGLPATDGATVVWADATDCLHAARVSDGRDEGPIAQLPGSVALAVSGQIVAWSATQTTTACPPDCPSAITVVDMATRTRFPLAKTHHSESSPALSGDWLVWLAQDPLPGAPNTPTVAGALAQPATYTVLARDLRTMAPPVVVRQTTNPITYVTVESQRVAWAEQEAATSAPAAGQPAAHLFSRQLDNGAPTPLGMGQAIGSIVHDLRGDLVLYSDANQNASRVTALNLRTGWRQVFDNAGAATTDGRYIFWASYASTPSLKFRLDILGYDTMTGQDLPLVVNAGVNDYPMARGGIVAWLHHAGSLNFVSQVDVAAAGAR